VRPETANSVTLSYHQTNVTLPRTTIPQNHPKTSPMAFSIPHAWYIIWLCSQHNRPGWYGDGGLVLSLNAHDISSQLNCFPKVFSLNRIYRGSWESH